MTDIPWIPLSSTSYSNHAVVEFSATQINANETQSDLSTLNKYQTILLYSSVCFTFSQEPIKFSFQTCIIRKNILTLYFLLM